MSKTLLYRLFGVGAIPRRARPVLEEEGMVLCDEGIGGWLIGRNVRGPGRRHRKRFEGFSGSLAVTNRRLVCFTYGKRRISIGVDDPRLSLLHVAAPDGHTLSIAFESGAFREGWAGAMEFRLHTDEALRFAEILASLGARRGASADGEGSPR